MTGRNPKTKSGYPHENGHKAHECPRNSINIPNLPMSKLS